MNWLRNPYNRVWLALAAASIASYGIGEHQAGHSLSAAATVLLFGLAITKGWLVIDVFMGLRTAPPLWRRLVLGWLLVVSGLLTALSLGLPNG